MNQNICIIGCGWLGFPLAQTLLKKGATIYGSTTSDDKLQNLTSEGINAYVLKFSSEGITGDLKSCLGPCDTLILNIPPGLRQDPQKDYVKQMNHLIPHIEASKVSKVLFISSTSVYDDYASFRRITESSPTSTNSKSARQLLAVERMFQSNTAFQTTVLRFSGLFGNQRHPSNFLSGRSNLKNGNAPVNLIHLTDCISIIELLISNGLWDMTLNASTTSHPSKKEYYTSVCKQRQLPLPEFDSEAPSVGKIIDSTKLAQLLDYEFQIRLNN